MCEFMQKWLVLMHSEDESYDMLCHTTWGLPPLLTWFELLRFLLPHATWSVHLKWPWKCLLFSFFGFWPKKTVTKFVGRKEADRVGSWRLRYVYLRQINSHRCALCVTRKHQLSRSSPRSLSVFVPTVSLWQLVRPSLHSVSLLELPFHGGFYPVSTPITTIRHRWSSFCTWPTYLPLSPESFSRCRLRWTTPPSPHTPTARLRPGSPPACSPPPPIPGEEVGYSHLRPRPVDHLEFEGL